MAIVIHGIGLETVKPIVNRDLNQKVPESLVELKPGTYYLKGSHQKVQDMANITIPNGGKYELRCLGMGSQSGYVIEGQTLIRIKRTDQGVRCTLLTAEEYKNRERGER